MSNYIAITGMGIISSIGKTVEENYNSLLHGKMGLTDLTLFESIHKGRIKVGEIKLSNEALTEALQLPGENNYTRTALLGAYAAKQAVANAGIVDINSYKTGLISSTSVGGMDFTEKYFYEYFSNQAVQRYIHSNDAGDSSHKIASYLGLKGVVTTISTACSSASNAIMTGARLIRSGKLDRVIVGGTDALSKFTINGFNTLMILSDSYNTPFDENRKGLNLGEAAAFLVLESEKVVEKERKKVLAYVSGFANANDSFHQTASSEFGDGAFSTMKKALAMSSLPIDAIDYINVHGTATPNNDLSEGRALERLFVHGVPDFSSTKPFTGHTLAAAGGAEAVYSVLALQHDVVFKNLNFETAMQELSCRPTAETKHKRIRHVMSNSFGFGGNCSTVIFSKNDL